MILSLFNYLQDNSNRKRNVHNVRKFVEFYSQIFLSKVCIQESTTFDPFTTLSIPVPKRIVVDTIVLYRTEEKAPTKFRINISADGTIADFKRLLSHKADLSITKVDIFCFVSKSFIVLVSRCQHIKSPIEQLIILKMKIMCQQVSIHGKILIQSTCKQKILIFCFHSILFFFSFYSQIRNSDQC